MGGIIVNETDKKDRIILNDQELSREDFDKKKEELEKKPGVRVVEIAHDTFKTRIKG